MDMPKSLRLIDRLRASAALWAEANGASQAKLGRLAINDSSYFNRVESPQGTTTATLEKFARFLVDPDNWPAGDDGIRRVPDDVLAFAHIVGVTSSEQGASPDSAGEIIGSDGVSACHGAPPVTSPGARLASAPGELFPDHTEQAR